MVNKWTGVGIHSIQGWTVTAKHGVRKSKKIKAYMKSL